MVERNTIDLGYKVECQIVKDFFKGMKEYKTDLEAYEALACKYGVSNNYIMMLINCFGNSNKDTRSYKKLKDGKEIKQRKGLKNGKPDN
jgi:Zn-dependent peptidase ImmA (M78 family)